VPGGQSGVVVDEPEVVGSVVGAVVVGSVVLVVPGDVVDASVVVASLVEASVVVAAASVAAGSSPPPQPTARVRISADPAASRWAEDRIARLVFAYCD
jgi:hypothetical protein